VPDREGERGREPIALRAPDARLRAVVVVPARDEEARIAACLRALRDQRGVEPGAYEVIVVLDGCTDGTAAIVRELADGTPAPPLHVVELLEGEGVGRARRLGMDVACRRLTELDREDGLIATTDADSVVEERWLVTQLELVAEGARAIGGMITLDPAEAAALSPEAVVERERRAGRRLQALRADASAPTGSAVEHHQFSGASLSLTAETYVRCGGLPVRAALEDEALERELRAIGIPIHRSRGVRVLTSARTDGRAPRGLARDLALADWRTRRTHRAAEFPLGRLLEEKSASIALVLPAREVAETIGSIAAQAATLRDAGLLDEVLVIDADSQDGSARIAAASGVEVVQESELFAELGPVRGKGDAMWRALGMLDSDIVAYADTDTANFGAHFLTGLLGPLVCDPDVQLVKGFFQRPFRTESALLADGGGRVTELMARPLLNLHAPELAVFDQPLAGETAARRELLERIPFSAGYGVEIAMLLDAWRAVGLGGLAQVDLGVRQNRHQPLRDLSAMAYAVLVAGSARLLGPELADAIAGGSLVLPPLAGDTHMEIRRVSIEERPPMAGYRERRDAQPGRPPPSLAPAGSSAALPSAARMNTSTL
jgi:glycosyltransferase involved in cell wall biosynthesis